MTPLHSVLLATTLCAVTAWAESLAPANGWLKRMCFHCNMPHQCESGFCYGDYCVKSISGNMYVSKGCENKSSSVYARSIAEKSDGDSNTDVGCVDTEVFGVSNRICYCNDNDFCNRAAQPPTASLLALVPLLLVPVVA